MIDVEPHRVALTDHIDSARRIMDHSHPAGGSTPVSREARGLTFVILFAAYESLLKSMTRTLLDAAANMRVSNKNLRPGLKLFALANSAKSIHDSSVRKLYSHGLPKLLELAFDTKWMENTVDVNHFPDDGSFMKSSQIELWCKIFDLPHPGSILLNTWNSVDAIVANRNGIAHGRLTADEVGREYSEMDVRVLIDDWESDWNDFINLVEAKASNREFYRVAR